MYILSICNVKALLEESLYWFWHYLYDARVNVSRCKLIHSMICPYISTLASIEDKVKLIFLFVFRAGYYYISLIGIISYWSSRRTMSVLDSTILLYWNWPRKMQSIIIYVRKNLHSPASYVLPKLMAITSSTYISVGKYSPYYPLLW